MAAATRLMRFPSAVSHDVAVEAWLQAQPGELGAIARRWYARLREGGDDIRELMHDGCPTACVGDAALAYVGVYRAHVNLGFYFGAVLPDPSHLLQGTGRYMRHVKLLPDALPAVRELDVLIEAALADLRTRLGTRRG